MTRHCAFLTMDSLEGYESDDHLLVEPLVGRGWQVANVPWRQPTDWNRFDLVLIRSPWDYPQDSAAFLAVLETIEASSATLLNPLRTVRWNLDKSYLLQLAADGVPIVPTKRVQLSTLVTESEAVGLLFDELGSDRLVLKPVIGANASGTFVMQRGEAGAALPLESPRAAEACGYLAQPFVPAIVEEGEYSLFYFAGELSHAVLKTPAVGDFRVQEEHGGLPVLVEATSELEQAAQNCLRAVDSMPLYARVDLVRAPEGGFWLMELELIEPSLYLRLAPGSEERLAAAVDQWMERLAGSSGDVGETL